ncbi:hypothetical protein D9615_003040 [Tricholomella constricta]|uniref:Cupredoxin n=1 Tax=Tricholomella constricta TaxID=117010 RepID=A0A8H5M6I3_9AGAR|nr:hypothetical protein D9615_003040 [Tricholomella constricta]
MRFFAVAAALFTVVSAETFTVLVGDNAGLTYSPESVVAKVGDTVAFRFLSKNHTVTQSTFAKPCEAMTAPTTGIDSGFQAVPPGATEFPEWSFTLDDDKAPIWFFCNQAPHCARGMVFAVNPSAEKTFASFKATAMGATDPAGAGGSSTTGGANPTGTGASGAAGSDGASPPAGNGARMVTGSGAALLATLGVVAGLVL